MTGENEDVGGQDAEGQDSAAPQEGDENAYEDTWYRALKASAPDLAPDVDGVDDDPDPAVEP